ncbi:hypothetical protein ACTXT7_012585 [Hymenolepis weldensis]
MRAKGLLQKLKHPEEEEGLWCYYNEDNFHRNEEVNRRNDRVLAMCGWVDCTEIPTLMLAHEAPTNGAVKSEVLLRVRKRHIMTPPYFPQDLRANAGGGADTNVYVETLQTIVVKPPWVDSVVNGGRPYVFQQDSPPSH